MGKKYLGLDQLVLLIRPPPNGGIRACQTSTHRPIGAAILPSNWEQGVTILDELCRTFLHTFGHLPHSGAKSQHVTWSKLAEKMTRSRKLLFSIILGIFGLLLVNAKPFLDPKQIPRTYILVHFEEGHNTLVSHHFFDNFSQWSAVKVDENEKTWFFENHCFS